MSDKYQQMEKVPDQTSELTTFTKWGRIIPELKEHAMSYFDGETQFQYAQCSKGCNKEMQQFDNSNPTELWLFGRKNNDLQIAWKMNSTPTKNTNCIYMDFINMSNGRHAWHVRVKKPDGNLSERIYQIGYKERYDGTAIEGALRFLMHRFRHPIDQKTSIGIDYDKWPDQLSPFLKQFYNCVWSIMMNYSIYDSFMKFMKESPSKLKVMFFQKEDKNYFFLPSNFAETNVFKSIERFYCLIPLVITDEQFLNLKSRVLHMPKSSVSATAINRKLLNWRIDENCRDGFQIKPNDGWTQDSVLNDLTYERLEANVCILTRNGGGRGKLVFHEDTISFVDEREPTYKPCL